ncbi:MAG: peptidase and DD-carboxypeptidase VanY/endolysin [Ilumatobacteraceae bacterium]|nr:peptidase and DD-carboxypeptidase VanY/endolysin [Ilumatobacteraceae bacterium]
MFAVAPISNVQARIGAIEQRVDPASASAANDGSFDGAYLAATSGPESRVGFDPFGAAYQQAVAASRTQLSSAPATSFSSASLRTATYSSSGVPGASVGQIGGYGSMPVPSELASYGNGRLPPAALESIGQGGHKLYAPAAESWKSAVAAARADGIDLKVTDSYRSYDQQVDLANRKGLYKDGGLGATPGTSNHGWGLAVDIDVSKPSAMAWVKANGYKYGFVEAVPREPWHWEYRPAQA